MLPFEISVSMTRKLKIRGLNGEGLVRHRLTTRCGKVREKKKDARQINNEHLFRVLIRARENGNIAFYLSKKENYSCNF